MAPPPICEDCDQPIPQPATKSTMAHSPSAPSTSTTLESPHAKTQASSEHVRPDQFPVPVDPPATATHKTEYTISGPLTPGIKDAQRGEGEKGLKLEEEEKGEGIEHGRQATKDQSDIKNQASEKSSTNSGASTEQDILPPNLEQITPSIMIEFCDRCRWAPRATWIQTELFLTFPNPLIRRITLIPLTSPETGGRFRVWVNIGGGNGSGGKEQLVWDRKTEGGFPELKVLKQRIRNIIQPDLGLGHSDVHPHTSAPAASENKST